MSIRGVLFDFDGTLTEPGSLDFASVRKALRCPDGQPVLEFINSLPSQGARIEAHSVLERFELAAAGSSLPNSGAEGLVLLLRSRAVKLGIISRNSRRSILRALDNFRRIGASDFDVLLTRDDWPAPKPSPESVLAAAELMDVPVDQILVVGDFVFDVASGRDAGAHTVFLTNRSPLASCPVEPEFTIGRLEELAEILDLFDPLPTGKLPNVYLRRFLDELGIQDASLVVAPGVGEDIAAVSLKGEEVLVLKSDPITFATDAIASYAVVINVNDIATGGAVPRWLTTSLLFPPGTSAARIRKVMVELRRVSGENGLILAGGHTEITDAVNRPVVAGQVVGTATRDGLIDKRRIGPGNRIILSKAIALEGTCILAREIPDRLRSLGISDPVIERCRGFLHKPGLSVVPEARIAAASRKVTGMHDVTEGGLATALEELSAAGQHRLRVFRDRIPVLEETQQICSVLGMDPLGLIASGSLLIVAEGAAGDELSKAIRETGVEATVIGEVVEPGIGVRAVDRHGEECPWPRFAVDEIARIFQDPGLTRSRCHETGNKGP